MRRALPILLLLTTLVAGCLADDATPDDHATAGAPAGPPMAPPPGNDIVADVQWWADFSSGHVKRDALLPPNFAARDDLIASLEDAGFDVEVRRYIAAPFGLLGAQRVDSDPALAAVIGERAGNDPTLADRRIGVIAHYDTQGGTLEGAYDNGSGTAMVRATCNALASLELRRTLTCIYFDGEEEGVLTSAAYAAEAADQFDLVIGFDMVGLNWPGHDWSLYAFHGAEHAPALMPLTDTVLFEGLTFDPDHVELRDQNTRNSDEASFASRGTPTIRFAGGERAGDYPEYHTPGDTVAFVDEFAGGRANYELGFQATLEAAYHMVAAFDATDLKALAANASLDAE